MRRSNGWNLGWCLVLGLALGLGWSALAGAFASTAHAQQLKPYFLVIVDTSGSMAWCAGGATPQQGNNDCSCHTDSADCGSAFKPNRCGFPSNRIGDAKCSLQRILDGTSGDAVFGLMQFEHPCDDACNPTGSQCAGVQSMCGVDCDDGQLAVAIASGNSTLMREWVDGECQGACGTNDFRHELTTGQWTPLAKSLQRANEYLRGTNVGIAGWPYVTGGSMPGSPIAQDSQLKCRPVSVILLTDGDDTCVPLTMTTEAAPAAAAALYAGALNADNAAGKAFRTYVIGFGASGGNFNPAVLNDIATRGGTTQYFGATDEASLSLALTDIISDAQPPAELCNNQDDDCDTKIDEGLQKYCNSPAGETALTLCDEPAESNCDNVDDDCDGLIDEGLTNACGACGDVPKEACDSLDNDCDSRVDEDTSEAAPCGSDKGDCQPGQWVCVSGAESCQGATDPADERCDCQDNDCDGTIDEAGSNPLCPANQRCAGCSCVEFCSQTTEFLAECRSGLTPSFQPNGECLCIVDRCDYEACPKSTIEQDGRVVCAPNAPDLSACECRAGTCLAKCTGIVCSSGEVCDPMRGQCVEDNCRGLGCDASQLCDPGTGSCVDDACMNAGCDADQVCRGGSCEASCARVSCESGQHCQAGSCLADRCATARCEAGSSCDPNDGACVAERECGLCSKGQVCVPGTGECRADPCWNVSCPTSQRCVDGECELADGNAVGQIIDAVREPHEQPTQLLATGGGGCACSVPGQLLQQRAKPVSDAQLLAAWLLFAAFGVRRWRGHGTRVWRFGNRHRWLLAAAALLIWLQLGGCRITPLCIDCGDAAVRGDERQTEDATGSTAGANANASDAATTPIADAGINAEVSDSGTTAPPRCVPSGEETCNDKDDDCDFKVDEDVQASMQCNQVGVCAGTTAICSNGQLTCRFDAQFEQDETLCDGSDNDCDGKVDESFSMLGSACTVGVGACKITGKLVCAASGQSTSCDATPAEGSDEICNGKDDDCDGVIDEPQSQPGTNPSYVSDAVVQLPNGVSIYKYEASRVDADGAAQGIIATRACSRAGVVPWTNVTYTEATAACESVGMTVCKVEDWLLACQGGDSACSWSAASCSSYTEGTCNGHDAATSSGDPDTDVLLTTGSKPDCHSDFAGQSVFDLSGNAREWAQGTQSPETNPLRGGSYNNSAEGLRCDFDFTLGAKDLRLPNIGFRCCSTGAAAKP